MPDPLVEHRFVVSGKRRQVGGGRSIANAQSPSFASSALAMTWSSISRYRSMNSVEILGRHASTVVPCLGYALNAPVARGTSQDPVQVLLIIAQNSMKYRC